MTTPTPKKHALALFVATLLLAALAACGPAGEPGEEGTPDPGPGAVPEAPAETAEAPDPGEAPHTWLQRGFVASGTTAEELRQRFGPPDARRASPTPNRHVPDQTDTLVTLEYEGLTVELYSVTGGEDLLQSIVVSSPGILAYDQPVDVGSEWATVTSVLGPPSGRRDGTPFYACEGCPAADAPVYFEVEDGVVRRIRFSYYVD
ncbi:MAG: hypothetical protein R3304_11255 [Longimicrobiales bacterium]|nr:hypothetical protein [Longimicrobiales bacterium]